MSQTWDEEKSLSPQRQSNPGPFVNRSDALTTELRETGGQLGYSPGYIITRVLHTRSLYARDTMRWRQDYKVKIIIASR